MFRTLTRLIDGGADLLGAEVRLTLARLERIGVAFTVVLGAALLGAAGLVAIGAGVVIALADVLGWAWSLGAVGGAAALLGGIAAWIARSSAQRALRSVDRDEPAPGGGDTKAQDSAESMEEARRDVRNARRHVHRALHGRGRPRRRFITGEDFRELGQDALRLALEHPEALVAATFAVASVVGPGRLFRVASRAVGGVSLAASIIRIAQREAARSEQRERQRSPNGSSRFAHQD
jgi:hypothetical protein